MPVKILKFFIGILFFPVCVSVSASLYENLSSINALSYYNQRYFLLGIISYLVVHTLLFKPAYLYIVGHEVMHVLATWLSFGKVKAFKVSPKGGSVKTTKSNIFIALAPYFFPFYTILVTVIYLAMPYLFKREMPYSLFMFLIGFTLAFHLVLTIDFLKIKQADFLHAGYFCSVELIYIINLSIVAFILSLTFSEFQFAYFAKEAYSISKDIYLSIFQQLFL
jgi:hypothetical protein